MGRNPLIIGITGKIGVGKDTVSSIISLKYDFEEINADLIGHEVLVTKKNEICAIFGNQILNNEKEIDRKLLGDIVFKDKKKLLELEAISHPYIYNKIIEKIKKSNANRIIVNAALLFKIDLEKICKYIILVEANEKIIFDRLKNKRNLSDETIKNIMSNQNDIFFKKNISNLKIINIINNKDYLSLNTEVSNKIKEVLYNGRTK